MRPKFVGVESLRTHKRLAGRPPLVMVTAYDTLTARMVRDAGVDLILVGDSLATTALGRPDTLSVTLEEMEHHLKAVVATGPDCPVVADMPWLSYHLGRSQTIVNAARLVRAGANAVKLEGDRPEEVTWLTGAGIPVMAHLGLLPQSVLVLGGYRVQGREAGAAESFISRAQSLVEAGCFALVLEAVPSPVAKAVTEAVSVPTIGIGAGPSCDGQVLVVADILGLGGEDREPRFVRRYADLGSLGTAAIQNFANDVRSGSYPSAEESYR